MLFGVESKFVIIVAPVVVIPDILSKKASLTENGMGDNKNGKLPNAATRSQANAENKKVCCRFNLNCFSKMFMNRNWRVSMKNS